MDDGPGHLAACISSGAERSQIREAGERLAALTAGLGADPVTLLSRGGEVEAVRHYPPGDVYDLSSHAQFYYHSHRGDEFGHIHLFQRPRGMVSGLQPVAAVNGPDDPCHLIAVGFGARGEAVELFTTNRWVTGEAWYRADAVKTMLPGLRLSPAGIWGAVAEWLAALAAFYRPLIEVLIDERDQAVEAWARAHPDGDALKDERLEITSARAIDPAADLRRLGG
jgi:hypothetical protein